MKTAIIRIGMPDYSYIEIQESLDKEITDEQISQWKGFIKRHAEKGQPQNLEVILEDKKCKKCGAQVVEQIGISSKNNKPYHYIKCINNNTDKVCDYIEWINVLPKE